MGIDLSKNDTLFSSYMKGWEQALKTFEEESGVKQGKRKGMAKKIK